jgi:hypothetical protein
MPGSRRSSDYIAIARFDSRSCRSGEALSRGADVLPVASGANANTLREHTLRVAERAEAELGEEQSGFIEGCPAQWAALPIPEGLVVTSVPKVTLRKVSYFKVLSFTC